MHLKNCLTDKISFLNTGVIFAIFILNLKLKK